MWRILLDARKWRDGGIGSYTRALIDSLSSSELVDLTVLVRDCDQEDFQKKYPPIKTLIFDATGYSVKEYYGLSKKIDWSKYDLFHCPHYTLPFRIPVKKIVTVHDLIHITHPEKKYYPVVAKTLISSALSRADLVLTVSKSSQKNLIQSFPKQLIEKEIVVVPNVLDSEIQKLIPSSFELRNNDKPVFLTIFSNFKPHKGIKPFLRSLTLLKKKAEKNLLPKDILDRYLNSKFILVGFGCEDLINDAEALEMISKAGNVELKGSVSQVELSKLLSAASCLVVPSFEEGFGIMALDAHAFKIPFISRPVPCLQELRLSADLVCSDFADASFTRMLEFFLSNQYSVGNSFIEEAQKQLDRHSLETMQVEILQSYQLLLGSGQNSELKVLESAA